MSFTSNIKNEISSIEYGESEKMAELSAILNIGVKIYEDKFEIYTENISVARRIYLLIKEIYHVEIDMDTGYNSLRGNKLVLLSVHDKIDLILSDLCIQKNNERIYVPDNYLVDEEHDKQAYLRGVFMICGSINDPKTSRYHLEFVISNEDTANYVNNLLNEFYFNSKVIKRDKNYMVYIKESEKISDFIKLLNARTSLFYYEDIRIYRDHKNMTNRLNNCEQANVDKMIQASSEQLELIRKLRETRDFDLLEQGIKDICIYKEKYPESSMAELAEIISTETERPITKSGINHRFRKIKEMVK
ncbi:putative sporulation transcription regulator WhiA [Clostridium sp. CAG:524]|jgi:DNA-binding protein WhiA|nr:DNA-binding protein WhiA [Clostridium sp.]CDA59763.1 putative sporulation transcription regulator WhiA [Clostridium sp. CAG:524]